MASIVMLKDPKTGIIKKGFFGFSWTTLFFGGLPAICRGDLVVGILITIASFFTGWIVAIIWAFVYNKRYTLGLIQQGYQFIDNNETTRLAKNKLGIE